ncbi:hypothetical protein B0J15DRAFT_451563 [Fusarium solani]|uniref:Rhodopsin domain-containing protein n=1 Tax=Fusarium solani TaxID=169388 RepID=A0A9P9GQE0_FUSSL|nr:uncharacterized protein B0J15DRAFT_451563 [Fusarium solani]KAH7243813.1 hypothetical protein B0J15DRAFT_451563 [Fusarium solani]
MKGDAPWALGVMWTLTFITLVFVILRVYTRVVIVKTSGVDDFVYNFAFILLLLYTVFIHLSANYGFGQNMFEIEDVEDAVRAVLLEVIGQTFAIIGMAVAKCSLGLFLLRLVSVNMIWHRMAIWATMAGLMLTSISVVFVYWLQCTPPAYLWDHRIRGGFCHINSVPAAFTLSIFCIIVDFFFAIFPWVLLWNLNMNTREKVIIAGSMSLGVFAGACGIKRTMELPNLTEQNYLKDTVRAIVWSAAEIVVTMVCIGIPVCRPLYKRVFQRLTSNGGGESQLPRCSARLYRSSYQSMAVHRPDGRQLE